MGYTIYYLQSGRWLFLLLAFFLPNFHSESPGEAEPEVEEDEYEGLELVGLVIGQHSYQRDAEIEKEAPEDGVDVITCDAVLGAPLTVIFKCFAHNMWVIDCFGG